MKRTAILLSILLILSALTACSGKDSKALEEIASKMEAPIRITATVKSDSLTAEMVMELYNKENDVTMKTQFTSPELLKGLVIERKKDGKLVADYKGINTELDDSSLKFVAVTHDIMQELRDSLVTRGKSVASDDERYGKAEIPVNDTVITLYYDVNTNNLLRITSDLFDTAITIDVAAIEKIE